MRKKQSLVIIQNDVTDRYLLRNTYDRLNYDFPLRLYTDQKMAIQFLRDCQEECPIAIFDNQCSQIDNNELIAYFSNQQINLIPLDGTAKQDEAQIEPVAGTQIYFGVLDNNDYTSTAKKLLEIAKCKLICMHTKSCTHYSEECEILDWRM